MNSSHLRDRHYELHTPLFANLYSISFKFLRQNKLPSHFNGKNVIMSNYWHAHTTGSTLGEGRKSIHWDSAQFN